MPRRPPVLRPNYGIDAPRAVRNLLVVGSVALLVCVACAFLPRTEWTRSLTRFGAQLAVPFLVIGGYMFCSSKFGKIREREWLLDLISWRGDETVLDVGCGLGVMLIGAAKRLTTTCGERLP